MCTGLFWNELVIWVKYELSTAGQTTVVLFAVMNVAVLFDRFRTTGRTCQIHGDLSSLEEREKRIDTQKST